MKKSLENGFSLIEALVAVLVLSFGLLGAAAVQLKALQSSHAGYQRSLASLAAQDAQERLWAELVLEDDGSYSCPDEAVVNGAGSNWASAWSVHLPDADTTPPVGSPTSVCVYDITVTWSDTRLEEGGSAFTFDYVARLPGEY